MSKPSNTPGKLSALLWACIIGVIVSLGANYLIYSASRNMAQTMARDTVPSIVAADQINALLADAHSNAMNAMVTKEKSGGKFWTLYRKDMEKLHSQLLSVSKDSVFGDGDKEPLTAIMANVSAYEYTLGGAVSTGAEISVDQFGEANRLMQQKILPSSVKLNKVYSSYLDTAYNSYIKNINAALVVMVALGLIFLAVLIATQFYHFRKTHRIFNIGLLLATILFIANMVYSVSALNSVRSDLYSAKHDAVDSIQALWSARATAYNANALESLYLLHNGTGIVQTADTINFNLSTSLLCSDAKAAANGEKFEGYLSSILGNITFAGEVEPVKAALAEWTKYVEIDKKMRGFEYDSRHDEAIALNVGQSDGQSDYTFAKFDAELGKTIDINQKYFESHMASAFDTLRLFPYVTLIFLVLIILVCMLGMKPRLEEYKA